MTHLRGKTGPALQKAQATYCSEDDCHMPQTPDNDRGPKYENDTPNNWLRGNGMKPSFDRNGDKAGR